MDGSQLRKSAVVWALLLLLGFVAQAGAQSKAPKEWGAIVAATEKEGQLNI